MPTEANVRATKLEKDIDYLAALQVERVGYEQKIVNAELDEDTAAFKRYTKHLTEVDAEIDRVSVAVDAGTPSEEMVDPAPVPAKRPTKRAATKPTD